MNRGAGACDVVYIVDDVMTGQYRLRRYVSKRDMQDDRSRLADGEIGDVRFERRSSQRHHAVVGKKRGDVTGDGPFFDAEPRLKLIDELRRARLIRIEDVEPLDTLIRRPQESG